MKKIIATAIVAISAIVSVNAQSRSSQEVGTFSVRPYVGGTCGVVTNSKVDTGGRFGLAAGADVQYMFNNWFAVSVGGEFNQGGWSYNEGAYKDKTVHMDVVAVPVMANFYVCKGLALKAGLAPTFVVNTSIDGQKFDDDEIAKFDLTGNAGISYEFKNGLMLEARINAGSVKLLKDDKRGDKSSRQGIGMLTLGYRF